MSSAGLRGLMGEQESLTDHKEPMMLLVREISYCRPGKVRKLVEMNLKMSKLLEQAGHGKMRVMTDFVAERYWTMVCEYEVESMRAFEEMMQGKGMSEELGKQMEEATKGYHDFIESGRREIYKVEG